MAKWRNDEMALTRQRGKRLTHAIIDSNCLQVSDARAKLSAIFAKRSDV